MDFSSFPTHELLAYDIELSYYEGNIKKCQRLQDLGLLTGDNAVIYTNRHDDGEVVLCRKLHGKGEDCLAIADRLIAASVKNLNKRPSVLFLTGDQIYADDVAGPLIQHLTEFGAHLLGWEEEIVGLNKKLTEIRPGKRQQFISEHAKYTSENGGNHLISFGEFAAMYFISWNIQNWPLLFQDIEFVAEKKVKRKYQIEIEQLKRSQKALPVVRRILANIPTYMMFDDHDITDDWNITREWNERVKESDYGKQIVANGLAAFWAFQGWGNDPSLYSDEFITGITQYLDKNGNPNIHTRKSFVDYIWNFHDWTFAAPTYPVTIFIDSRTQRKYDSLKGPPILLNDEGLESISRTMYKVNYYNKGDPILIAY